LVPLDFKERCTRYSGNVPILIFFKVPPINKEVLVDLKNIESLDTHGGIILYYV
jgi:hypothetical protein